MQLKDGALLAAHPQRLFDRIQKDAKEVTLKEARALGADERSFVSLKDLIEHFATSTVLQRKTGSSSPVGWKGVYRNRSVVHSPARSSILRLSNIDCVFNVNMHNRVFSQHTRMCYMCAPSLSPVRSIASKRLSIDFSTLKP